MPRQEGTGFQSFRAPLQTAATTTRSRPGPGPGERNRQSETLGMNSENGYRASMMFPQQNLALQQNFEGGILKTKQALPNEREEGVR